MNAPVNIVYPIHGGSYPVSAKNSLESAYLTFSFSVTKGGGSSQVEWGVDNQTFGSAKYYDMFSAQFVWKLASGSHQFWVRGPGLSDRVEFNVY